MGLQWRATCTREPAMPLRPGAGKVWSALLLFLSKWKTWWFQVVFFFLCISRRWFSIQKNQLVYQKKFKVQFRKVWKPVLGSVSTRRLSRTMSMCLAGTAHGCGGGPASLHSQDQLWKRATVLLWSGVPFKVSFACMHHFLSLRANARAVVMQLCAHRQVPQNKHMVGWFNVLTCMVTLRVCVLDGAKMLLAAGGLRKAAARMDQCRPEQHRLSFPRAAGGYAKPGEGPTRIYLNAFRILWVNVSLLSLCWWFLHLFYQRQRCSSMSQSIMRSGGSGGCVDQENNDCQALEDIQAIPGNRQCCDCGEPSPDWASINLGITLCIVCSGIHR